MNYLFLWERFIPIRKSSETQRPLMRGLYYDKAVSFVTTEVSDKAIKNQMGLSWTRSALNPSPCDTTVSH
jgi:hypothetical protein